MSGHVYTVMELVGSSETSIEDAIQTAITRASQTLRNLHWFEVSRPAATSRTARFGTIRSRSKPGLLWKTRLRERSTTPSSAGLSSDLAMLRSVIQTSTAQLRHHHRC